MEKEKEEKLSSFKDDIGLLLKFVLFFIFQFFGLLIVMILSFFAVIGLTWGQIGPFIAIILFIIIAFWLEYSKRSPTRGWIRKN